ncbi:MAG TPA: hypothetical protein VGE81_07610 [Candidatus Limnocylindrales bacterium]
MRVSRATAHGGLAYFAPACVEGRASQSGTPGMGLDAGADKHAERAKALRAEEELGAFRPPGEDMAPVLGGLRVSFDPSHRTAAVADGFGVDVLTHGQTSQE